MELHSEPDDVILRHWAFERSQFRGFYHVVVDSTLTLKDAIRYMLELGFVQHKVHHSEIAYSYEVTHSMRVLSNTHPYMEYLNSKK